MSYNKPEDRFLLEWDNSDVYICNAQPLSGMAKQT